MGCVAQADLAIHMNRKSTATFFATDISIDNGSELLNTIFAAAELREANVQRVNAGVNGMKTMQEHPSQAQRVSACINCSKTMQHHSPSSLRTRIS